MTRIYLMPPAALLMGEVTVTAAARERLTDAEVRSALKRHGSRDWGDVAKEQWFENDDALLQGEAVRSEYRACDGRRFQVVTDAGRSATTVLLPGER